MANNFDDFSKNLAGAGSRRHALKVIGLGAVGAVAGAFGMLRGHSSTAEASRGCLSVCRGKSGDAYRDCIQLCACRESGGKICGSGKERVCCPPWTTCSSQVAQPAFVNGGGGGSHSLCVPIPQYFSGCPM